MRLDNEPAKNTALQDEIFSANAVSEGLHIEDILNRAHEIHRAHGGLFGYDLEDWLQAERESVERNRPDHFRVEETTGGTASPRTREELQKNVSDSTARPDIQADAALGHPREYPPRRTDDDRWTKSGSGLPYADAPSGRPTFGRPWFGSNGCR